MIFTSVVGDSGSVYLPSFSLPGNSRHPPPLKLRVCSQRRRPSHHPQFLRNLRGDRRSAHPVAAFCCDGFNVAPDVSRCKQFLRYLVLPNTYCPTYIFRLQTNAACITIAKMNTPEKTIVGGIRLTPSYWTKFRQVWKARGREWMLRWIDKEHSKLPKDGAP